MTSTPSETLIENGFEPAVIDGLFDAGVAHARDRMAASSRVLIPNRPTDIVEWCEDGLALPFGPTNRPGALRFVEWQKGFLRAFQEPEASIVSLMCSPRVGKSVALAAQMLYYSGHEEDDTLYFERSADTAQSFHDKTLYPMMTASPAIRPLVRADSRSGVQDKWTDRYLLNGACLQLRSASMDGAFRGIKGRRGLGDEVDDPARFDDDEDPKSDLLVNRGANFVDFVLGLCSSPSDAETTVIGRELARSDWRTFRVPCQCCGTFQEMKPKIAVDDKEGPALRYRIDRETGSIAETWYECADCNHRIRETDKHEMIGHGYWQATKAPDRPGLIGMHLWAAYSFDEGFAWDKLAMMHYESLSIPSKRQTVKNQALALPFEKVDTAVVSVDDLFARAEPYEAEVPSGVRIVTWAADTQRGQTKVLEDGKAARIEVEFVGWGHGEECWILGRWILDQADPLSVESKAAFIELITREFTRAHGTSMRAAAGAPDVNESMHDWLSWIYSPEFQDAVGEMEVYPVVGMNEAKGSRTRFVDTKRISMHQRTQKTYWRLGTQTAKDTYMARLRLTGSGPERMHFPQSLQATRDTKYDFFKGLTMISRKLSTATNRKYWEDKTGNEPIDLWVYNFATLQFLLEHQDVKATIMLDPPDEAATPCIGPDRSAQAATGEADRAMAGAPAGRAQVLVRKMTNTSFAYRARIVQSPLVAQQVAQPYTAPSPRQTLIRSSWMNL